MTGMARAGLPDAVLDNDYKNCVVDGQDRQRNAYCLCIRQGESGWSLDTYVQAATEASNLRPGQIGTGPLDTLAKQCMAKIGR